MKKNILYILMIISCISLVGCEKNTQDNNISDNENKEHIVESFEKKLTKLEQSGTKDSEIQKLFFENIEIETKKTVDECYLISLTNNTPYDLSKISIVWDPIKDGISQYNPYKTYDRTTSFSYVYSGEKVHQIQCFINFDNRTNKAETIVTDKIVANSKTFKDYYEAKENSYKDLIISNVKYDSKKGVIYTLENPTDGQKYPNVDVLYYKDDEIIYVENKTQYYLYANTTLKDFEFSKSPLTNKYELVDFEFDKIEVVLNNSK